MTIMERGFNGEFYVKTIPPEIYVLRTHEEDESCEEGCVIHHPSDTVQNRENWPYNWRGDRGIMERICEHGIGHPDWDSARHFERIGQSWQNIHGCCGICCTRVRENT